MTGDGAISKRRAALLAHALPVKDREWLLGELDADDRVVLSGLLEELRQMGIPRDAALLRQVVDDEAGGDPERSLAALPEAALPRLLAVLQGEPEAVVAGFLRARTWPWRETVLQELGVHVRETVACPATHEPTRLRQAIVASVWTAVQEREPASLDPGRADRWSRFLRRASRA